MEVQLKRPAPGNASPAPYGMSQLNSQVFGSGNLRQGNQTMMISCKDVKGQTLTVDDNAVGFAATDVTDAKQRWIKVKDPVRKDAFAIVNLGTGKAIKIPGAAQLPVCLVPYKLNDTSLLWTVAAADDGYSSIREFVNANLALDAVHQGLQVVVSNYTGADGQLWMMALDK